MRISRGWSVSMAVVVSACTSTPQSSVTDALSDAEVAAVVVTANAIDAELGEVAAERAVNGAVREFGRAMARDHRAVNERAAALVTTLGIEPAENGVSRQLRADAVAFRAELEKLSGAEFDRSYVDHEVSYHQAVIAAVDDLLIPNARRKELREAITNVRPALVAHLQHARHLHAALDEQHAARR